MDPIPLPDNPGDGHRRDVCRHTDRAPDRHPSGRAKEVMVAMTGQSPSASSPSDSRSKIRTDRPSTVSNPASLILLSARERASGVAPRILASSLCVIVNSS